MFKYVRFRAGERPYFFTAVFVRWEQTALSWWLRGRRSCPHSGEPRNLPGFLPEKPSGERSQRNQAARGGGRGRGSHQVLAGTALGKQTWCFSPRQILPSPGAGCQQLGSETPRSPERWSLLPTGQGVLRASLPAGWAAQPVLAGWTGRSLSSRAPAGRWGQGQCAGRFGIRWSSFLSQLGGGGQPKDAGPSRMDTSEQNNDFCSQRCFPVCSFVINRFG